MKADLTPSTAHAPGDANAGRKRRRVGSKREEQRREDMRYAQKKFKEANLEKRRKRIQFYVPISAIEALKAAAESQQVPVRSLYEEAIINRALRKEHIVDTPSQITTKGVSDTPTTTSPSVPSQSDTKEDSHPTLPHQPASVMTEAQAQEQREIMQSQHLKEAQAERDRLQRSVASLRKKLPPGHPYNPATKGRGKDIGERAPKMYRSRDAKKNEALRQLALKHVREQAKRWRQIEDNINKELQSMAKAS